MKCPVCWAEKAYVREVRGWKGTLLKLSCLLPMKCHHCYHKFSVLRPLAMGKKIHPPALRVHSGEGQQRQPARNTTAMVEQHYRRVA